MKTFGQFIKEDTAPLSITQFPIIASTDSGKKRLAVSIDSINAALAAGQIQNARYNDLKFAVNRMIDDIRWTRGDGGHWLNDILSWAYHNDVDFFQPNHAAGKLKLTQKILKKEPNHKEAAKYAEYATEVATLHAAMEKVKTLAVKRQPLPAEDPHKAYIAPMASREAGRKVIAVLKELTEQIKTEYIKMVFDRMVETVEKYYELRNDRRQMMNFSQYNPEIHMWSWHVFEKTPGGDPTDWKKGWREYLQKEANDAGEFMQQQFLAKNAKKLAKIVELKDNLSDCRIIGRAHVMQQGIGGEIAFEFTDGSRFRVKNSVKDNRSSAGKWFSQFPTTFHDVILPNGKAMSTPSEQRMIEVFAVAKAA